MIPLVGTAATTSRVLLVAVLLLAACDSAPEVGDADSAAGSVPVDAPGEEERLSGDELLEQAVTFAVLLGLTGDEANAAIPDNLPVWEHGGTMLDLACDMWASVAFFEAEGITTETVINRFDIAGGIAQMMDQDDLVQTLAELSAMTELGTAREQIGPPMERMLDLCHPSLSRFDP